MCARIGTFGFAGSAGLALSGGISYGPDSAGFGKFSGSIRFAPEGARSARNIAQQPARRRIEDRFHEKPARGVRVPRRYLHERRFQARLRRGIFRIHGNGEVAQPSRAPSAPRAGAPCGRFGTERARPPHTRYARGTQLVLPPPRTRTVARRRPFAGTHRKIAETGASA